MCTDETLFSCMVNNIDLTFSLGFIDKTLQGYSLLQSHEPNLVMLGHEIKTILIIHHDITFQCHNNILHERDEISHFHNNNNNAACSKNNNYDMYNSTKSADL